MERLKAEEEEKKLLAEEKEKRKLESVRKKKAAQERKAKKEKEKARKAEEKAKKVAERWQCTRGRKTKRVEEVDTVTRELLSCTIEDKETWCPICNALYDDSSSIWICCDKCNLWYNLECTNVPEDGIPDTCYCDRC